MLRMEGPPADTRSRIRPSRTTQSRRGFSLESLNVLQTWLDRNRNDPYPTQSEKDELSKTAKLTTKQISNWFSNARKRQLDPLQEWLSSGSEDGPATTADIIHAMGNGNNHGLGAFESLQSDSISSISSVGSVFDAHSDSSSAFTQCSDAVRSTPNRRGKRRYNPMSFGKVDKRERQIDQFVLPDISRSQATSSSWQCTFCHKEMTAKSWKRHEESQHLPRYTWTCSTHEIGAQDDLALLVEDIPLHVTKEIFEQSFHTNKMPLPPFVDGVLDEKGEFSGSVYAYCRTKHDALLTVNGLRNLDVFGQSVKVLHVPQSAVPACVYCYAEQCKESCDSRHRTMDCSEKPDCERTFYRKDGLIQHLKRVHNLVLSDNLVCKWRTKMNYAQHIWTCGFCGGRVMDWNTRATHIAAHFRSGLVMRSWKSDQISPRISISDPFDSPYMASCSDNNTSSAAGSCSSLGFNALAIGDNEEDIGQAYIGTGTDFGECFPAYDISPIDATPLNGGFAVDDGVHPGGNLLYAVQIHDEARKHHTVLPEATSNEQQSASSLITAHQSHDTRFCVWYEGTIPDYTSNVNLTSAIFDQLHYDCLAGCTNRWFQRLSDWREHAEFHEIDESLALGIHKCVKMSHISGVSELCGEVFWGLSGLSGLSDHLQMQHGVSDPATLKTVLDQSYLDERRNGRRPTSQFWCGFCKAIVRTIGTSPEIDRRLEHLTQHILASESTKSWVNLWMHNIAVN